MPLPLWIALWFSLGLLVLSVTLGGVYCFRNGLALWRGLKTLGAAVDGAVTGLTDAVGSAAERATRIGDGVPRLEEALARLHASLRRWSVLSAAVQDVRSSLVAVYPRK